MRWLRDWLCSHPMAAVTGTTLALLCAIALLAGFWRGETVPPSAPEAAVNAASQAVTSAAESARKARTKHDETVRDAYQSGKESVANLSADAVVAELNALLDELRGGSARQQ